MVTGFAPFTGTSKDDLKKNLEKGNYMFPKSIRMSLEGLEFMNCCLQHNPDDRMTWNELMKHQYFKYDYKKYMDEGKKDDEDDLMLSYNQQSGTYSTNPYA
jgi:serine/threonine protein kinase